MTTGPTRFSGPTPFALEELHHPRSAVASAPERLPDHCPVCESGSPSRLLAALADKGLTVRSNPAEDRRATLHALYGPDQQA